MIRFNISELTKSRIQALKECLDFSRNGWVELSSACLPDAWVIFMRKNGTGDVLKIRMFEKSYDVWKNGVLKKIVRDKPAGLKN